MSARCSVAGSIETTACARSRMRPGRPARRPTSGGRSPTGPTTPPPRGTPRAAASAPSMAAADARPSCAAAPRRPRRPLPRRCPSPRRGAAVTLLGLRVAAEAGPEEVRPHEAQARLERARVEGEGAAVLGDRAVDLEGQAPPRRRALAPTGVVRVAGRERLGERRAASAADGDGAGGSRRLPGGRALGRAQAARRATRGRGAGSTVRSRQPRPSAYACRTHFTSSGKVGFFPYMRMPTR